MKNLMHLLVSFLVLGVETGWLRVERRGIGVLKSIRSPVGSAGTLTSNSQGCLSALVGAVSLRLRGGAEGLTNAWSREQVLTVPGDVPDIIEALRRVPDHGCIYLRDPSPQILARQADVPENRTVTLLGEDGSSVEGKFQLFEDSVGRWFGVKCRYETFTFIDQCILVEGGFPSNPWRFERCEVECCGGTAIRMISRSCALVSECGLHGDKTEFQAMPLVIEAEDLQLTGGNIISCLHCSTLSLASSLLSHSGRHRRATKFVDNATGVIQSCVFAEVGVGVGVEDAGSAAVRDCTLNCSLGAFCAEEGSSCAGLTLDQNQIDGWMWFGKGRPGKLRLGKVERSFQEEELKLVAKETDLLKELKKELPQAVEGALKGPASDVDIDKIIGTFDKLPRSIPPILKDEVLSSIPPGGLKAKIDGDPGLSLFYDTLKKVRAVKIEGKNPEAELPEWVINPEGYLQEVENTVKAWRDDEEQELREMNELDDQVATMKQTRLALQQKVQRRFHQELEDLGEGGMEMGSPTSLDRENRLKDIHAGHVPLCMPFATLRIMQRVTSGLEMKPSGEDAEHAEQKIVEDCVRKMREGLDPQNLLR